jgi:hypothetical protein
MTTNIYLNKFTRFMESHLHNPTYRNGQAPRDCSPEVSYGTVQKFMMDVIVSEYLGFRRTSCSHFTFTPRIVLHTVLRPPVRNFQHFCSVKSTTLNSENYSYYIPQAVVLSFAVLKHEDKGVGYQTTKPGPSCKGTYAGSVRKQGAEEGNRAQEWGTF